MNGTTLLNIRLNDAVGNQRIFISRVLKKVVMRAEALG